jgi:hypothetical protein
MNDWEALTALAEESQTMSAVLLELDADEFKRSTNCPPWDLKELVVHTAASIGLRGDFRSPEPSAPLRSAADYYRRPERATPQYRGRNVDAAQALAADLPAGMTAAGIFARTSGGRRWPSCATQDRTAASRSRLSKPCGWATGRQPG